MRRGRRLPSPATVIACIALVGAWGGPALADALITGADVRNGSLTSRDVKNKSLSGRDLRSNTITGRNVKGLSGRDILPDTIDGWHVFEENLGEVPRARQAGHADSATRVGSTSPVRAQAALAPGADHVVVDAGALRIRARCQGAGQIEVTATTTADGSLIRVSVVRAGQAATYAGDDDFRTGDTFDLLPSGEPNALGQLVFSAPGGATVSLDYFAEEGATGLTPDGGCVFGAHGLASSG